MKLSEAIRLGAMLKPQGFGAFQKDGASCALGAALDAIGNVEPIYEWAECDDEDDAITSHWPWLNAPMRCPVCGQAAEAVTYIIAEHLNDNHRWTREQIAEWVHSQEALAAPEAVAAVRLSVDEPVVSLRG